MPGADAVLVTERPGRIRRIDTRGGGELLGGVPPLANLFDLAFAADFHRSRRLYFTLVREEAQLFAVEVWTATLQGSALREPRRLHRTRATSTLPPHLNAARLLVVARGQLIVSVADLDDRDSHAQEVQSDWGKLVLVREAGAPRTLALGVRNAQGLARDARGRVLFTDHGPRGGDELNLLSVEANYGWPRASEGVHYDGTALPPHRSADPAFTAPLVTWTPAIAPSSLLVYQGGEFPEWHGSLLVGSLAQRNLRRLERRCGVWREQVLLGALGERIRDVRADAAGRIYVLTDGPRARLLRLVRARTPEDAS